MDTGDLAAIHLRLGPGDGGNGPEGMVLGIGGEGGQKGGDAVGGAEIPEGAHLPGPGDRGQVDAPPPVDVGVDKAGDRQHPMAVDDPAVGVPRWQDALDPSLADAQVAGLDPALQHRPDIGDCGDNCGHSVPLLEPWAPTRSPVLPREGARQGPFM